MTKVRFRLARRLWTNPASPEGKGLASVSPDAFGPAPPRSRAPDAFGPAPPHPRAEGWPPFCPTPSGQLRLTRGLKASLCLARGLRDTLRLARPPRGGFGHAQGIRTGLRLARRPRTNLAPFDVQRLVLSYLITSLPFPHDDGYSARQDVRVNHGFKDHTLRPDRKGTARERLDRCFRPSRAPQSPKGIAGAYSSPCRVVGAAFSSGTRDPMKIHDNHYTPEKDL